MRSIMTMTLLLAGAVASAQNTPALPAQPAPASDTPAPVAQVEVKDGPGKDVFLARCSNCHALTDVVSKRKSRDQWDLKVREMINFGATLTPDEIKTVTSYLAAQYGL